LQREVFIAHEPSFATARTPTPSRQPSPPVSAQLTIPERLIRPTHLRFSLGCLLVSIVAGGPGSFIVFYFASLNAGQAWRETVSVSVFSIFHVAPQVPLAEGLAEIAVFTLSLFVDMYLTGYLRRLIVAAEPKLSPLAPSPGDAYRKAFAPMTSIGGSLFFAVVFFCLYFPARADISGSPIALGGIAILSVLAFIVYGAAFWVYLSGVWGVFRFGREPLQLKPFYEDSMLGLRPLGQIVVSSAGIFSIAITITLGASLITGDVSSLFSNLAIVAIGISMLFLPLLGIHGKMVAVKELEEAKLGGLSRTLFAGPAAPGVATDGDSLPTKIRELIELQRFQSLKEDVSRISEWPFESRSIERVVAILLAIFAALLARLVELPH
jgi:hypothetical protein